MRALACKRFMSFGETSKIRRARALSLSCVANSGAHLAQREPAPLDGNQTRVGDRVGRAGYEIRQTYRLANRSRKNVECEIERPRHLLEQIP